jgi:hypothetical protein
MVKMSQVIIGVTFPSQLKQGELIAGTITCKNVLADNEFIAVTVTPSWQPAYWAQTLLQMSAGQTVTFNYPSDFLDSQQRTPTLTMPDSDAVLTIEAALAPGTLNEIIETQTVTIKVETSPSTKIAGLPLWMWIVGGITIAATASIVAVTKFKKKSRR